MVDKTVKDKKPEEPVTIEEEDLFEDFPASKGDQNDLHLFQRASALCSSSVMVLHCRQTWPCTNIALQAHCLDLLRTT